jgi:RND family efflux transporter MFP subunit
MAMTTERSSSILQWKSRIRTGSGSVLVGLVLAGLVLAGMGCGQEPVEAPAEVSRPVKMLTLGAGAAGGVREYPGSVKATQNSEMAFEVPGRITEFPVDEGMQVEKGGLLARLDPRDFEADRDATVARMNMAKAEYERYMKLYEDNAVSLQDLDVKRRNFEVTESRVRTAEKAVQDTELRAPFSGRVAKKLVEDFQNVQAKETILILQDESGFELIVNLPEGDAVLADPGLSLEERTKRATPRVAIGTLPGRTFPARIKEFATTADPVTRTYDASFAFEPPAGVSIRSGMTGKVIVNLPGDETGRFSVPTNAVTSDESGNPFVWKVDPDSLRVSRVSVTVGEMSGSKIEISAGLVQGDRIAVSGVSNLREGMLVRPLE